MDHATGERERIVLGISGSSALPVGLRLLEVLLQTPQLELHTVFTEGARQVAKNEFGLSLDDLEGLKERLGIGQIRAQAWVHHPEDDLGAPISSGSFGVRKMVVAPCSMGTLAAIAHGMSDNLLERAADVVLKERGLLVLVPREAPLSLIHLENMVRVARAGGVLVPPVLTFYHRPDQGSQAMVDFIVGKVLDLMGISHQLFRRWGQ